MGPKTTNALKLLKGHLKGLLKEVKLKLIAEEKFKMSQFSKIDDFWKNLIQQTINDSERKNFLQH